MLWCEQCMCGPPLQVCSYDYERLEFILEQLDAMAGRVEVHSMTKVRQTAPVMREMSEGTSRRS